MSYEVVMNSKIDISCYFYDFIILSYFDTNDILL